LADRHGKALYIYERLVIVWLHVPVEEMRKLAKEEYEKWLRESRHTKPIEELEERRSHLA